MPKTAVPNNQVTIQEAASILGVSQKTLRRWEDAGKLTPSRTKGGHRRYSQAKLEYFKNTQKQAKKVNKILQPIHPIAPPIPFQAYPEIKQEIQPKTNLQENNSEPESIDIYTPLHIEQKKALKT